MSVQYEYIAMEYLYCWSTCIYKRFEVYLATLCKV